MGPALTKPGVWLQRCANALGGALFLALFGVCLVQLGARFGFNRPLPWTIEAKLEVELASRIDKARWGEGLATEASLGIVEHARATLGLSRLVCLVMPGNERSAAVASKVGMRFEREHTDEFGLCHLYAVALRSDGAA